MDPRINPEKFFYCKECETVSYRFDCCGNSYCNGSGCEKCDELHSVIGKMINEGEHPPIENLPQIPSLEDLMNGKI